LSVVLHGSETWPLTLREEHKLEVLEKRVQRKVLRLTGGSNRRVEKTAK